MFSSKSKIFTNVAFAIVGGAASFLLFSSNSPLGLIKKNDDAEATVIANTGNKSCGYSLVRTASSGLSNPLLMVEPDCEADKYKDLKASIQGYIDNNKVSGRINNASVYFRNLSTADWIDINPQFAYHPGSLAKVPMLFAYLRRAETDPASLKKVLYFDHVAQGHVHTQTFNSKAIEKGHSYTVRELLDYMIGYSDNAATYLLNTNMGFDPYFRVFAELGLRIPEIDGRKYQMTPKEYSRFFIVLYNSTYLSNEMSQMACSILNNNEFTEGILKGLPTNVKTIHKFGESGDINIKSHELHESAIIFIEGSPYLLTIMTNGQDKKMLPEILTHISELVYSYVEKEAKAGV